eukprot:5000970-Prymnesium_polylepis.1
MGVVTWGSSRARLLLLAFDRRLGLLALQPIERRLHTGRSGGREVTWGAGKGSRGGHMGGSHGATWGHVDADRAPPAHTWGSRGGRVAWGHTGHAEGVAWGRVRSRGGHMDMGVSSGEVRWRVGLTLAAAFSCSVFALAASARRSSLSRASSSTSSFHAPSSSASDL